MSSIFKNYSSSTPEFQQIGEVTRHSFRLSAFKLLDSFQNYDGSDKEELPVWEDPVPQLAVVAVSTEGKGGITHRFNGCGYVKFDDLSKKDVESGKFEDVKGYAVTEKDGHKVRKEDPVKTQSCLNILNQFYSALGMKEGSSIDDLNRAIEDGYTFMADVVNDPYDGRDQFRLTRFRKASAVEEPAESDDFDE